jgi:hypothetical protein
VSIYPLRATPNARISSGTHGLLLNSFVHSIVRPAICAIIAIWCSFDFHGFAVWSKERWIRPRNERDAGVVAPNHSSRTFLITCFKRKHSHLPWVSFIPGAHATLSCQHKNKKKNRADTRQWTASSIVKFLYFTTVPCNTTQPRPQRRLNSHTYVQRRCDRDYTYSIRNARARIKHKRT